MSGPRTSNLQSCYADTQGVMTTTTDALPGYKVTRMLGTIYGIAAQARDSSAPSLASSLKNAALGESGYIRMIYTGRNEAMQRMVGECLGRGGNAVLGVRMDNAAENRWSQFCAYGTACVVEKVEKEYGKEREE